MKNSFFDYIIGINIILVNNSVSQFAINKLINSLPNFPVFDLSTFNILQKQNK